MSTPRWLGRAGIPMVDAGAWAVGLTGATWLRYEFALDRVDSLGLARIISATVAVVWIAGIATHLYLGRYPIGSLDEVLKLALVSGIVCLSLQGLESLGKPPVPRSVPFIAACLAMVLSVAARLAVRHHRARKARPQADSARRVIVYGAGMRGRELVRAMLSGAAGNALPVALLDDDPALRHTRISGVPVRGTWRELASVARKTRAQQLVVAFGNAAPAKINAVKSLARTVRLDVMTVPPLSEQLRPWTRVVNPRELDVAELLGRPPIEIAVESVSGCLRGKRVLVAGAGGSIGSELCRQVHELGPAQLVLLDSDESALHALRLSLHGEARLDSPDVVLGDITDTDGMSALLGDLRPDVVFHAAGLKQLAVLERYPGQAWKTNVLGTLNLLEAARLAGVRRFVNVSTIKAANPTSVLGRAKRITERLVADAAGRTDGGYVSVRLGEVLGTRGSVLDTFVEQIAAGRPVTVSHPDATRFFMTIPEAVRLLILAAAIGRSGDVLTLDLGAPTRLGELAELLVAFSCADSPIVYTGLGRGEHLHERLFGTGEQDRRPVHPAVSHLHVPPLAPQTALDRCARLGSAAAMAELVECPRIIAPRAASPAEMTGIRVIAAGRSGKDVEHR
ncbi:polysaccharide biosynthesis protein [Amycolatopsis taiwanensis]|uniref:polysaccharide biosynthesis protein n=1 Tax=Amycolatopsis taiwanensis TaxID=342230 RepID=UPI00146FAAB4|nr:polysaccharide biosynthesis protein [Amycolatopsis taiwanensis]